MDVDFNAVLSLLSLLGTFGGSMVGILVSTKLTTYRLGQLEKKVDKHNHFAERLPVIEEQIRVINHRLTDLEQEDK